MILQYVASSPRLLLRFCAFSSALVLSGAYIGQYGFELFPCDLCLKQRYPYMAIIAIGLLGAYPIRSERVRTLLAAACMFLFFTTAGIAMYHAGVEWGIFTGPSGCSNTGGGELTLEEMRAQIMNAPLVSCDQAMAYVFGLSLAAWNALIASALGLFVLAALVKRSRFKGRHA